MIKIESNFERVAQLDEQQTSNLPVYAGSNPVTFVCEECGASFSKPIHKALHIRWQHKKNPPSEKLLESRKKFSSINYEKLKCKCQFCGLESQMSKNTFVNHVKHCKQNPNRVPVKGHPHSEETKRKLSEKARSNPYRRLMRHTQSYNGILYDSSWEVELAKRLESLNETFERPKTPIKYIGEDEKEHNYFPDFYLPNRKVFVEIKNPYLFENDSKVQILKAKRNDIIWLTSLEQIHAFK